MTFNYDAGRQKHIGKTPDMPSEQPPKTRQRHPGKEPDVPAVKAKPDKKSELLFEKYETKPPENYVNYNEEDNNTDFPFLDYLKSKNKN